MFEKFKRLFIRIKENLFYSHLLNYFRKVIIEQNKKKYTTYKNCDITTLNSYIHSKAKIIDEKLFNKYDFYYFIALWLASEKISNNTKSIIITENNVEKDKIMKRLYQNKNEYGSRVFSLEKIIKLNDETLENLLEDKQEVFLYKATQGLNYQTIFFFIKQDTFSKYFMRKLASHSFSYKRYLNIVFLLY